jgi:uncharacterized protein YmfQ (DUF2313 family)
MADTSTPMPQDRHVRRGQDEYQFALSALLPHGIAWPRWPTTVQQAVVRGLAGIWGYIDGRAADLLERESDPRLTVEMLDSWEKAWGLPDPCLHNQQQTIGQRQQALVLKMTLLGAQSRAFMISVAAQLGYSGVTITEYRPFMVGLDRCGDNRIYDPVAGTLSDWPCQIGKPDMRFAWTMHVGQRALTWFRSAKGQAGIDPHLTIDLPTDLICKIQTIAPGHTDVIFDLTSTTAPGDPMEGTP